jgi:hypothetical protein
VCVCVLVVAWTDNPLFTPCREWNGGRKGAKSDRFLKYRDGWIDKQIYKEGKECPAACQSTPPDTVQSGSKAYVV